MVLAEVSFADVFWSVLWFFFLLIWIVILFHVITDLFRDREMNGFTKFIWILFLIFLPFLAVLVYVLTRGDGMTERTIEAQKQANAQFADYVQSVSSVGSPTEQIANAKELLDAGTINQAEFDQLKAKALA